MILRSGVVIAVLTADAILEIYDELAEAIVTGRRYQTRLDPPPADPCVAHPPR